MKHLINKVFLILLLIFTVTCKKKDDKIEELIIGEWYAKDFTFLGWSTDVYYSNEYEFKEGGLLVQNGRCTCGCSKDINGNYSTAGDAKCYTEYKIENGELYILYCVFHQTGLNIDSVSQVWNHIPIKRINKDVMVLGGKNGFPEQKFIKQ